MNEDQRAFQQLKWAVQALAASAEDQFKLFPSFVCAACELLSDFENWHGATIWRSSLGITPEQRSALDAVKSKIAGMRDTPCFSDVALRDREDWKELRLCAASCLSAFGWARDLPPDGRSTYLRGG